MNLLTPAACTQLVSHTDSLCPTFLWPLHLPLCLDVCMTAVCVGDAVSWLSGWARLWHPPHSDYLNPFAGDGAFKFHPYSGRPFKLCKSKIQAIYIHLFTSLQIIHDRFFKKYIRMYASNDTTYLHTCSVIFIRVIFAETRSFA